MRSVDGDARGVEGLHHKCRLDEDAGSIAREQVEHIAVAANDFPQR